MSTVKEKEARKVKAVPLEIDTDMYWCVEHRVWSGWLAERTGRNGQIALELASMIRRPPYEGFVPITVWDSIPLESFSRGSSEASHWFPSQDLDKVMLTFHEGDTVWRCGHLQDCGRWWPDKASAEACYDSH